MSCYSLRDIKIPSVRIIEVLGAFLKCKCLTDAEFGTVLELIGEEAFARCFSRRRISIPLKYDMFTYNYNEQRYTQFDDCDGLARVDVVRGGEIYKTVSHLSLQSWRNEMNQEIKRINQILPTTTHAQNKAEMIDEWIQPVLRRLEHYKAEHYNLLMGATTLLETLLELALWKAKLRQTPLTLR
jgi:hypothetical protein